VFFERRLSVAESGSVEDDLRLVLILPDGLREDRFARGPQAFDGAPMVARTIWGSSL